MKGWPTPKQVAEYIRAAKDAGAYKVTVSADGIEFSLGPPARELASRVGFDASQTVDTFETEDRGHE